MTVPQVRRQRLGLSRKERACIIEVCFAGIVDLLRVVDVAVFANFVCYGDLGLSRFEGRT